MIVFPPPSLHKYFRFNNHSEHLSNTDSGALQELLFGSHRKAPLTNISVANADPLFESARKISSCARERFSEAILGLPKAYSKPLRTYFEIVLIPRTLCYNLKHYGWFNDQIILASNMYWMKCRTSAIQIYRLDKILRSNEQIAPWNTKRCCSISMAQ